MATKVTGLVARTWWRNTLRCFLDSLVGRFDSQKECGCLDRAALYAVYLLIRISAALAAADFVRCTFN